MKHKVYEYEIEGNTIQLDPSIELDHIVSILDKTTVATLGVKKSIIHSAVQSYVISMVAGLIVLDGFELGADDELSIQVDDGRDLEEEATEAEIRAMFA